MSNGKGKIRELKVFNKNILEKIQKEGPGGKLIKDKNILKFARQQKPTGRLSMDDLISAEKEFKNLSPGEKKARFGEMDDYQNMVAKKLEAGMEGLMKGFRPNLVRRPSGLPPMKRGELGTKPVLDTKGKPVENLRQKATNKMSGGLQDVDVIDLTTEMVIDE